MKIFIKILLSIIFLCLIDSIIWFFINDKSGESYSVTYLRGKVRIQYKSSYLITNDDGIMEPYEVESRSVPLKEGMKIGGGAVIQTEPMSFADFLLDNGMAIRVREASLVKLEGKPKGRSLLQITLIRGNVLIKLIAAKLKRLSGDATYKVRIDTPLASCGIKGTSFSIGHSSVSNITKIAVLEGSTSVFRDINSLENTGGFWSVNVGDGKKVEIKSDSIYPTFKDMTSEEQEELLEADDLKVEESMFECIGQLINFNFIRSLYNSMLIEISKREMNSIQFSLLRESELSRILPKSLDSIKLLKGGYQDAWGSDYLYVRINPKSAILISAGPDKIPHSTDDIYMYINL